jgi:hypothetical protein
MRLKGGLSIAVFLFLAIGCDEGGDQGRVGIGDGSGLPPPPPPPPAGSFPGGIWIGELTPMDGEAVQFRGLIAETGEFRLVPNDESQHDFVRGIFGTFQLESGTDVSTPDAFWAPWGPSTLWGKLDERVRLSGEYHTPWNMGELGRGEFTGTFSFAYDALYERESSLAILAGTYTTPTASLSIDDQGALFYQSSDTFCVGNGSAAVIDPDFNMYRLRIELASCLGDPLADGIWTLTGLAYLRDSGGGMSDIIDLNLTWGQVHNCDFNGWCWFTWSLVAQK